MNEGALGRLVAQTRMLPGNRADLRGVGLPRMADRGGGTPATSPSREEPDAPLAVAELSARVGALLAEMGRRTSERLPATLELAHSAWDQVDSLVLFDLPLRREVAVLRRASRAAADASDAPLAAIGLEAELTLDAAVGLVSILERRLATLARLRLRSETPELVRDGRPFLDVGAALLEAARGWV